MGIEAPLESSTDARTGPRRMAKGVRRLVLVTLCAMAAGLALSGAPAMAERTYLKVSSFGSGGALPQEPLDLAVDQNTGDVLVADQGTVQRFIPVERSNPSAGYTQGSPLEGSFARARAVAVDNTGGSSNGDVYVADAVSKVIDKFESSGKPDATTPQFGAGASPIPLSRPTGVAVDPANGDVYVADGPEHLVDVYSSTGKFESQFGVAEPTGLAFNSTGTGLYVAAGEQVEEFDPSGNPIDQTAGPDAGTNIVEGPVEVPTAVAVSPSTNDVYIPRREGQDVAAYDASGAPLSPPGFTTGIVFSLGVAVDGTSGAVYVADSNNSDVTVDQLIIQPTVTTGTASHVTETSATLEGAVNPEGVALTSCVFEYGTSTSYEASVPCTPGPAVIGSGTEPVPVHAEITGLLPHHRYHFRVVARNTGGAGAGADQTFGAPLVDRESSSEVGVTTASLSAELDAEGRAGSYRFEYGTSTAYGSTTPAVAFVAQSGTVSAAAPLSGLLADTIYHARVVVTDAYGTTQGADLTLTTFSPSAYGLPDGRVLELVTPVANEDAAVFIPDNYARFENEEEEASTKYTRLPFQASVDGTSIAYAGDATSGGSGNKGEGNEYLATRAPRGGWTQTDITPFGDEFSDYKAFSDDLSTGILESNAETPLTPEAPGDKYKVLYTRTSDGRFHPLFTTTPEHRSHKEFGTASPENSANGLFYAGASADLNHLLFEANDTLTPNAVDGGSLENNLYDSTGGSLHLVNVLPDGAPDPNASFGSSWPVTHPAAHEISPSFSHAISADGSRIFWTDLNTGDVYVRVNGATTIPVSAGAAFYWTASPDGRYAFYTEGGTLVRFDVESGQRVELAGAGAGVEGVIGVNEVGVDGAYVYFVASGSLATGATAGQPNLYVRHGDSTTFIATLAGPSQHPETLGDNGQGGLRWLLAGDWKPSACCRTAEVTPDGHAIVFMSERSLTGYTATFSRGEGPGQMSEVFVYDANTGELNCASCNESGEPPAFTTVSFGASLPVSWNDIHQTRVISEDGNHVFFDSPQPLVPQDTNGVIDAYEWERDGTGGCRDRSGCIYLLSRGTEGPSFFVDASASGADAFFVTRARLVPQDQNELFDLYDARVGGIESPTSPQCSGVGCQGVPPAPPAFATPASATFSGLGDFPPPSAPAVKSKTAAQIRAEQLAKALKACRKDKSKTKRKRCEASAHKRYGAAKASRAKKANRGRRVKP